MGDAYAWGWGVLVGAGWLTGFLSGLLGIGGGLVIVPALMVALPLVGVSEDEIVKVAIATSLVLLIPTSLASSQAHAARGNLDWDLWTVLAPGIVAGGLVAAMLVQYIDATLLILLFAGFALLSAWRLLFGAAAVSAVRAKLTLLSLAAMSLKGVFGGALSTALGTGVAFFAVPILSRWTSLARAIGTASALALPMAIAGAAGYLLAPRPLGCATCTGYVHLPAVAAVGIGTVLAAPIGAQLTTVLPARRLQQLFALVLIVGAISLLAKKLPELAGAAHANLAFQLSAWREQNRPATVPSWLDRQDHSIGAANHLSPRRPFLPLSVDSPAALVLVARLRARLATERTKSQVAPFREGTHRTSGEARALTKRPRTSFRPCPAPSAGANISDNCPSRGALKQPTAFAVAPSANLLQTLFGDR